jgi:hypothetical protein
VRVRITGSLMHRILTARTKPALRVFTLRSSFTG